MEVQIRLKREWSQKLRKKSLVASVFLSEVRGKSLSGIDECGCELGSVERSEIIPVGYSNRG